MQLNDIMRSCLKPCSVMMGHAPHWRCDLPAGHACPHASIHVNRFDA